MFRTRWLLLTLPISIGLGAPAAAQLTASFLLQETSGTTAVDTTLLANNGTYTNGVLLANSTAVPSNGALAANFDGVNDYIAVPNEANYDITGAITVCCWTKVDVFDTAEQAIVTKGDTAWRLAREASTNFVKFHCNGLTTNTKVVSTVSINDGQWHHIAGVYTGAALQIYIDGVLNNSVSASGAITANNNPVEIARNNAVAGREFDGAIYNVVIYNGVLPGPSITAICNWDGMAANWKLTETSGTTATDSSIMVNNGTYTSGPTLAAAGPYPGAGLRAANFDGTDDYVATANEYNYDISGPISVAAWIKVDTFTKQWQAIVTKGDTAWRLTRNDSNNTVRFTCTGLTTTSVSSVTSVNDGAWHHVVGVYTGSQLQIYIDGLLNASAGATGAISRNAHNVQIARNAEVASKEFDGRIHDVRIYTVALSATKVAQMYGLVGHWNLNQTSGTTATDTSGCGSNGTLTGTTYWSSDCGGMGVFDFDGSSNNFSITSASHLQPTSAITITAWIKGDAWGAGSACNAILRKGDANPNNYQLDISDGRVELLLDGSEPSGHRGNTVLTTGVWYHVAAVWDGATVRVFVNGVLDNSPPARTGTIGIDTRPLYIGGRPSSDMFNGMVRDVRLYNRALYDVEIRRMAGLVGYWAFLEGSGTTAADTSGPGNNATLSGGASWTTDCSGSPYALLTNGTGGIAQTGTAFLPPDVGTVTFWMRSTGAPVGTARILGLGGDWEIRHNPDGRIISDLCGDGATTIATVTPLTEVGRWYHFAATFDSSNESYALYVDGKLELSGTNPVAMSQQQADILSFGTRTGTTEYWNGALRDVRVYNRKLCPTEIAALYGLIGHWKLDETSGTTAADSSGMGRNMTVVGTANWTAGSVDNCLQLNGSTRVEVTSLLGSPSNVTIAAWANLTAADSGGAEVVSLGDHFAIRLNEGSTSKVFFYNGSTWVSTSVAQTFTNTGWHHFAAVFNDTQNTCKFYIDGVEVASTNTTVTLPYTGQGTKTVIGAHGNNGTTWDFTGKIDDVRVYSRAICPTEIQTLYDSGDAFEGVKIIKWVEIQ